MNPYLRQVTVLLRLRIRLLSRWGIRKYTRTAREAAPVRALIALLVLGWFAVAVVVPLTLYIAQASHSPVARGQLAAWLTWAGTVSSVVIFAYSILSWIGRLTYASDLRLLIMSPLSPALLLTEKLAAASLSYTALLLLTLPGTVAIGENLRLGVAFDLVAVVALVLLPVIPACLSMLLVLAVLQWMPPARARTISSVAGVVIGGGTFVVVQLFSTGAVRAQVAFSPPSVPPWLPITWPARALAAAGLGHPLTAAAYLVVSFALTTLLAAFTVRLAGRQLTTGSESYGEVRRGSSARGRDDSARKWPPLPSLMTRSRWGALWTKDWLTLRRDPVQVAQLCYPLILVAFYVYRYLAAGTTRTPGLTGTSISMYSLSALTAVLVLGSFVPMLVNKEGQSLYLLTLAPVSARSLFVEKWSVGIVPPLLLSETVLAVLAGVLHANAGTILAGAACVAVLVAALVGLTLSVHLVWPRLNASAGRRQASTIGGIVSFVANAIIAVVTGVLLSACLSLWQSHPALAAFIGFVTMVGLFGVFFVSLLVGPRLFARLLVSDGVVSA